MIKITTHVPDTAIIVPGFVVLAALLLSKVSMTSMVSLAVVAFGDINADQISENYRIT